MIKEITAKELAKHMKKENVTLIDVRETYEHEQASIKGAHLIPLHQLSLEKLEGLTGPFVIYCRSGGRSLKACEKLLEDSPEIDVANLSGGITAWIDEGFEIIESHDETDHDEEHNTEKSHGKKGKKKSCSAHAASCDSKLVIFGDKKLRKMIGALTLGGVILGSVVSGIFYIIPAAIGGMLLMSGREDKECAMLNCMKSMADKLLGKK